MQARTRPLAVALRAAVSPAELVRTLTLLAGLLVLVLASAYALYTPPFQVPDEPAHFFRAYQLAEGICREPATSQIPRDVTDLMKTFPNNLSYTDAVDDLSARIATAEHRAPSSITNTLTRAATAAGYSCLTYGPAAAGIGVARAFGLPVIDVLYAARLGNAVAFSLMAGLALFLLPAGLRPFGFLLAAMPMTLAEAGSAAQDAVVNGIAVLFIAYVAWLAWAPRSRALGRREVIWLIVLAAALGQCKLDFPLVLLVLLIPPERWRSRAVRFSVAGAAGAAALATFGLWQHFGATSAETSLSATQSYAANVRFLLHDPSVMLHRLGASLVLNRWFYVDSFIGRLGWLSINLPPPVIVFYACALMVAVLAAPAPRGLTPLGRALCLAVGGGLTAVTFVVFWVVASPYVITQFATGLGYIEGVQGRYLIPFALPLAFGLAGAAPAVLGPRARRVPTTWAAAAAAGVVLVGSCAAFASLYREYFYPQQEVGKIPYRLRHPGHFYDGKFIHQVGLPDEDQVDYVYNGLRFWIENPRWFRKHHVNLTNIPILPVSVVRRIPVGETIYDADTRFQSTRTAAKFTGQFALDSRGDIWLVVHGVRHRLTDSRFVRSNGYPLATLTPAEFADIPVGDDIEDFHRLDGQLIQATDAADPVERARVYLVVDGSKSWIVDAAWLDRHGRRLDEARALPASVVDRIPEAVPIQ